MGRCTTVGLAGLVALCVVGCETQPWVFRPGVGIDDAPPARLLAEVYEGECGFACRPTGRALYCEELDGGEVGAAPAGLVDGTRYCFVGTASGPDGQAEALGCVAATAGGRDAIDITLSAIDEGIERKTRCSGDGMDGGHPDAGSVDAGPRVDAGPVDAGPPQADAGPLLSDAGPALIDAGPDAGPPPDSEITLTVLVGPGGQASVTSLSSGRTWTNIRDPLRFNILTSPGRSYRITATPDSGFRFVTFEGGGCSSENPCVLRVDTNTEVEGTFAPE